MKIYIVTASQGEYSDRSEWPVCAYRDEALARAHAEAAQRHARDGAAKCDGDYTLGAKLGAENPWDPGESLSGYDAAERSYYAGEIELRDVLPASAEGDAPTRTPDQSGYFDQPC